jgi:hypothetical protein
MNSISTVHRTSQPIEALQRANHVRCARAALKRRIADGDVDVAEVILACPPEANRMPIQELLRSQRGWGQTRCHGLLSRLALREDKLIGSLTERQSRVLATQLTTTPHPN